MDDVKAKLASLGFLVTDFPEESAKSPEDAVQFLVGQLVASGMLGAEHRDRTVNAVLARERLGSTAIGQGIAIPHAALDFVPTVLGVLARSRAAIPWESVDGCPVYHVCLVLGPVGRPGDCMRALERVRQVVRGPR
jgi:mannitol/fructose-specific phosphotransferase system IIA component (Ntr-type)